MSASTARLGIMTADDFKSRTKASKNVCGFSSHFKSRGSSMNAIDAQLESWDRLHASGKGAWDEYQRASTLIMLVHVCGQYLQDRGSNDSSLAVHRRGVVQQLRNAAENALVYVKKRATSTANALPGGKGVPQATGLKAGYANERQQYVGHGKAANPYSGTAMHEVTDREASASKQPSQFGSLNVGQFMAKGSLNGVERVEFLKRDERLKHLVIVKNGLLYQNGEPYSCDVDKTGISAVPYAMDRHGNIFSKKSITASRQGLRFNHSTFCAGREVICAGTLACVEGELLTFTNLSGHYQPDGRALRSALILLGEEGIDLDQVAVYGFGCVASDGRAKGSTFVRSGPPAAADWYDQGKWLKVKHRGQEHTVWEPA